MRKIFGMGLIAAALALAGCGDDESNAPTAAENAQLDNAAEMLDTSADSLTVQNPTLGNGDAPAEVPLEDASDNAQLASPANAADPTNAQ